VLYPLSYGRSAVRWYPERPTRPRGGPARHARYPSAVQFGIVFNTGTIDQLGELSAAAEEAGWDGVFYWDAVHLENFGEMHDPWVGLTVMAMRTSRVRLGAIVMAVPRHRPWLLARAATSVDHASHGRLILPVGIGALDDTAFAGVGEPTGTRERAERLDETLEFITAASTGEPFAHEGTHYRTAEMTFLPRPVQRPRVPIWVVGAWPREKSMQRVVRYDGILPNKLKPEGGQDTVTTDDIRAIADYVRERRGTLDRFDIVTEGRTSGMDAATVAATVRPWADAGCTWWTEADWRGTYDDLRRRIEQGPPRLD
jgi:alkanesulfonate monooxygenase SsuD/methylene tetrahydromethanopterin reductase-like flavin-dependent oxidoreductase (luciferase family)